jgi:hypothetical protein
MAHKVVAHFQRGLLIKGETESIRPDQPICHIVTRDRRIVPVPLAELKALFVVKDWDGNSAYVERHTIEPADVRATGAKRLEIMFTDGECLFVLAPAYDEARPFFFVLPADPNSNNVRILVNRAAIASVRTLRP